jgi:hypothetical protein
MKKRMILLLTALLALLPLYARAGGTELTYLTVADNAVLPEEAVCTALYPASVTTGEQMYDLPFLLDTLLGEGWYQEERTEWDYNDTYRSAGGDGNPWQWRTVRVYDKDSFMGSEELSYYNPWITGERGGEYQPPNMNMMPDESELLARTLLDGILPEEWLTYCSPTRAIRDRWAYSDRWMTDKEYAAYCKQQKQHYIVFNATTQAGIPVLSERIMAIVAADGLSGLDINWRELTESEEMIAPMPLSEAFERANSTRSRHCTLLYAGLVYSNWLTGDDTHNLCWYLVTDAGNYVVDCVLKQHRCDSYEY